MLKNNTLKIYIIIFLFIFSSQSWTKADDIRDFEIEGMSVGDSLLNYMTIKEINKNKRNYFKEKKRYYVVGFFKTKTYDNVDIYLKTDDKNYEIRTLSGQLNLQGKRCESKKNSIVSEIQNIFPNLNPVNYENSSHSFDKTGDSKLNQSAFLLKNHNDKDHIRIECTFWSKKIKKDYGYIDHLNVAAFSTEILQWFLSGYN